MVNHELPIDWKSIAAHLRTLQTVSGGYTTAQRGIVTLADLQKVFVKIGHDENTKKWAQKEIAIYEFLEYQNFPFMPQLLAVNNDRTGFAIEPLETTNGWDWSDNWTTDRLNKTLEVMDTLAEIVPTDDTRHLFEKSFISKTAGGWRLLASDIALQDLLKSRLVVSGLSEAVREIDFIGEAIQEDKFALELTTLVHNDVRADNCAWHKDQRAVKLVDWNWAQRGDRRIDRSMFLVHVYRTGFDITPYFTLLDSSALHWLAGFWFRAAIMSPQGISEQSTLRDYQLASGVAAYRLSKSVESLHEYPQLFI